MAERAIREKSEESAQEQPDVSNKLLPSNAEMRDFLKGTQTNEILDACSAANFDKNGPGVLTPEGMKKYGDVREALNGPQLVQDGDAGQKEEAGKALGEVGKITGSGDLRTRHAASEALKKQFDEMPPEKVRGVITEMNKELEGKGYRVAQSPDGAVWLGKRNSPGEKYYIHSMLGVKPGCARN